MASPEKIAIFVDYENIRMGLKKSHSIDANPSEIAQVIKKAVSEHGEMLFGYVYGDWSIPHSLSGKTIHTARAFEKEGFSSVMVSTKASGQDRSDSRLILDAQECLYTQPNISAFMIISGDGDFAHLCRKLRGNGKRVIICAFTQSANAEILSIANPFISVESVLNLDLSKTSPQRQAYNWDPFISQLSEAEKLLPFVSFKHFRDKWLLPEIGPIDSPDERNRIVNEAKKEGIAEVFFQENPNNRDYKTAAIKLNLKHPLVKQKVPAKPKTKKK